MMNGFAEKGLDEDAFGEKSNVQKGLQTFDAFRMFSLASTILYLYLRRITD